MLRPRSGSRSLFWCQVPHPRHGARGEGVEEEENQTKKFLHRDIGRSFSLKAIQGAHKFSLISCHRCKYDFMTMPTNSKFVVNVIPPELHKKNFAYPTSVAEKILQKKVPVPCRDKEVEKAAKQLSC